MDDCGLGTKLKDIKLHIEILHFAFDLLAKNGLHLKLSKSIFMKPTMDFLGVRLTKEGATVDPAKIAGIADWPENITTLKGARSFIGVLGCHGQTTVSDRVQGFRGSGILDEIYKDGS